MLADDVDKRRSWLRAWRDQFDDTTPIGAVEPDTETACVGVVQRLRLVPGESFEVTIEDGTGLLTGAWRRREDVSGVTLGDALRLHGVVTRSGDDLPRIDEASWNHIRQPHRP